jgi:hypothetical protein
MPRADDDHVVRVDLRGGSRSIHPYILWFSPRFRQGEPVLKTVKIEGGSR